MILSLNFTEREFASHDGRPVPPELLLNLQHLALNVLEPIREKWGAPIVVTSGYRSPEWNARVGGAQHSTHMLAKGADIHPVQVERTQALFALIEEMHEQGLLPALGGLGHYPNWVHVDTNRAADGHLRRWSGSSIGAEQ